MAEPEWEQGSLAPEPICKPLVWYDLSSPVYVCLSSFLSLFQKIYTKMLTVC